MREILFRGKRVCNGKWCLGVPYTIKDEATFIINNCRTLEFTNKDTDFQGCKVIPETIGQFTGLTDKNGVKIFEGDILKSNMYNKKWIVDFTPCDGLKLAIKYEDDFKINGIVRTHEDWSYNKISSCEIIGNIHETNK